MHCVNRVNADRCLMAQEPKKYSVVPLKFYILMHSLPQAWLVTPIRHKCRTIWRLQSEESQTDHWLVGVFSTDLVSRWTYDQKRDNVSLLLWLFYVLHMTMPLKRIWIIGVCWKIVWTLLMCIFFLKEMNDNHHVNMVDMFQSKDFVVFAFHVPLLSSFLYVLNEGNGCISVSLNCIKIWDDNE